MAQTVDSLARRQELAIANAIALSAISLLERVHVENSSAACAPNYAPGPRLKIFRAAGFAHSRGTAAPRPQKARSNMQCQNERDGKGAAGAA
jgi:hypothetical protein